ncbi:P-type ATPase [Apophysomyces sp. BC1015]|nr:P-type ATPase [Apophysomyces sp. BC1015]
MSKPNLPEKPHHVANDIVPVIDGKASIEHQIEIHVHDLFDVKENKSILLAEVLEGLAYVMDFRIKGGSQPHLDIQIMRRLSEALLLNTGQTEGNFLRKRPTNEANMAFFLFGDFLEEVEEFRDVVVENTAFELQKHLKIHYRCQSAAHEKQKQAAIAIIHLLKNHHFDWRDLIKESAQDEVERQLSSCLAGEVAKANLKMPIQPNIWPPQALHFDRTVEKLLRMFWTTDPDKGLPSTEVQLRRAHYGSNKLPTPPRPSVLKMLLTQLTDFMVLILLGAAIIEAGQQDFNSMTVLLIVIILNTVIGFSQEWKANKTLNALMNLGVPQAQVIRDGEPQLIASEELVPGDLVILEEGGAVPADIRLIEVAQLELMEAILTGESLPVLKNTEVIKATSRRIPLSDCTGNAFMSTTVARGRAKGIVVRTGVQAEIGKISTAIHAGSKGKQKTPIQRKLQRLGTYLVILAVFLCALVVVIGIAWKKDVKVMINVGLSLAVSVIPEGLVAVTTVTMAFGVRRMAANQCIVRTLPAVESLGSVTIICSDKTGTLTEGKMGTAELWTTNNDLYSFNNSTSLDPHQGEIIVEPAELRRRMIHVRRSFVQQRQHEEDTVDYTALRSHPLNKTQPALYAPHLKLSLMVASLCNNATVAQDEESHEWRSVGDPTEVALIVAAQKARIGLEYWSQEGFQKCYERAFDSERKLMSTVYRADHATVVLCKGAPEELLEKCSTYVSHQKDGNYLQYETSPITESFVAQVSDESTRMATSGLRVLGLGLKKLQTGDSEDFTESDLSFVGLVGLIDPPKEGVKDSVAICQQAGIRVMMITGDHIQTAKAIATKLGIFQQDVPGMNRAILGRELDLLSEDALTQLDPFPNVFARVSPDNKLKIVTALQQRGELVAMTGDGVNDAPAIKCADVGVAMGQAGTEITKQAADLVLLNDNFNTIVAAVEEGRHVFDNILKFIVYLLSCNGAEIFLMLICAIADLETPLTVMMILWANIIADIPPAMALGVEPKEPGLMKRPPRQTNMGVLNKVTWTVICLQSLYMAASTIAVYVISLRILNYPVQEAQSLAFAAITTQQLIHSFLSRSIQQSVLKTGILRNRWMIGAFVVSFGFMLLGIYCPGQYLHMAPTVLRFTFVELEKFVIRKLGGSV